MIDFISLILILGSLSVITFLILRRLVLFEEVSSKEKKEELKEEKFLGKSLEEWDEISKNLLEIFLRKIKIVLLKIENQISFWLEALKKEKEKSNFPLEKLKKVKKIRRRKKSNEPA